MCGDSYCGECGDKLTESNMWSEWTCRKCAVMLGLIEVELDGENILPKASRADVDIR